MSRTRILLAVAIPLLVFCLALADDSDDNDPLDLDVLRSIATDKGEKLEHRLKAIDGIAKLGPNSSKAVPELVALLEAHDLRHPYDSLALRGASVRALVAIGPSAKKETLGPLLKALNKSDWFESGAHFNLAVVVALGQFDPSGPRTVEALDHLLAGAVACVHSPEPVGMEVVAAAAVVLQKAGPQAAPLVERLYTITLTEFRCYAGMGFVQTPQGLVPTTRAISDEVTRPARLEAVKALRAIGTAQARNCLGRIAFVAKDEAVKKAARDALKKKE